MGDPKMSRRKYDSPSHPWQAERIQTENELRRKYGLKNKREIWKAYSYLRHMRQQARSLQALNRYGNPQASMETKNLIARLDRLGILPANSTIDDVLALDIETVLGRRVQTLAYMKGLAHTPKQARQFIVQGHIAIKGRRITIPGYLVKREEEDQISYHPSSPLMNEQHPMRPQAEPLGGDQTTHVERTVSISPTEPKPAAADTPAPVADKAGGEK